MERGHQEATGISGLSAGLMWALKLFPELAKTGFSVLCGGLPSRVDAVGNLPTDQRKEAQRDMGGSVCMCDGRFLLM